ncbi:MAG: hypothetical protein LUF26_00670 [Firmicutes bacterium]|nr:hypothetical protein [Bacillota bacterium]
MDIKVSHIERAAYAWIYSSIFIFLIGFLKWYISVPVSLVTAFALYLVYRKGRENQDTLHVEKAVLIIGAVIAVCWMLLCGQGGVMTQGADWAGRDAQLKDLINYSWPVYYSDGSAFTYYIGHFLVPSVFGKMFGLGAARACLFVYTAIAVYITWLNIIKILKADTVLKQLAVLLLLMLFGNTEALRQIVNNLIVGVFGTSSSYVPYGFTPNNNAYAWTFNQVCCAFLVLSVIFEDDARIENFALLGVPMVLYSPFMLIGVFVLAAAAVAKQVFKHKNDILSVVKRIFSVQNLCVLIALLPILLIYLSGNIFAEKPDELGLSAVSYSGRISVYIIFVLFEFMLYSICVFPRFKRNIYFYAANLLLMTILFFSMGKYNDLVTRTSSVGLFVLMLMTGDFLVNEKKCGFLRTRKAALCVILSIAAVPVANSWLDSVKDFSSRVASGNYSSTWVETYNTCEGLGDKEGLSFFKYQFYTHDAKEHLFFKYLAKK